MMQWIRYCSLQVANNSGNGLDLSQMRITFEVAKTENETPNHAQIKIYNLSKDTENQIINEFTRVILQAGYKTNYGVIFDGQIVQSKRGRDDGMNSYIIIDASDGDAVYNYSIVNQTLSAGSSQLDTINAVNSQMGLPVNSIDSSSDILPRGKVLYGNSRDIMRQTSQSNNQQWSIQDGKLQVLKNIGILPNMAINLNSKSGLVGTPEQATKGIKAKALINPQLHIGAKVIINENDIALAKINTKEPNNSENKPATIAKDGAYKIIGVEHKGDTYGNDWYSEIICIDIDETVKKAVQ